MINLLRKKYDMLLASSKKERKYYCEVEYLENTGSTVGTTYPATQYIDTGIVPANTIISGRIKYCYTEVPLTDAILGGTVADNTSNVRIGTLSGKYRIKWNNQGYTGTTNITAGQIFEDEFNTSTGFYSNGTQVISTQYTSVAGCKNSIYLFTDSTGSALGYNKSGKRLYYCQIYQDGVLVRDYIPVLDWNYVPCLYDRVTKQLFYNQGTGEFLYGREIHEVEYIESTGTQYIDTGLSDYTTFRGTAECTANSSKSQVLIGDSSGGGHFLASRISSTLKWGTSTTTETAYTNVDTMSKADFEVNFDNGSTHGYVNNDSFTYSLSASFSTFTIFKNATGNSYPFYGKLFSLKAYQNNVLVRDFIPIVDENFNGYLFDKVNRKIYENAGTGSFGVPDIEVEYIESTGTQYIDTGIKTNDVTSVYCKFAGTFGLTYSGKTYSGQCFGSRISTTNNAFYYANGVTNDSIGNGSGIVSITRNANTDFSEITYSKTNYEVTGTSYSQIGSLEVGNITSNFNFYLFGINDNGSANLGTWKYSSFKLYTSSGLTGDFIPVIHNGVACLKNTIDDTYLINAGTGAFSVGKIKESA